MNGPATVETGWVERRTVRDVLAPLEDEINNIENLLAAMRRVTWDLVDNVSNDDRPWLVETRNAVCGLNAGLKLQMAALADAYSTVWNEAGR